MSGKKPESEYQSGCQTERKIESKFSRRVRRLGGLSLKFASPGWRGAPDRIVIVPGGRIVFVEFKAPGKKTRPLQAWRHQELQRLGCDIRVVDSSSGAQELLRELFGGDIDNFQTP